MRLLYFLPLFTIISVSLHAGDVPPFSDSQLSKLNNGETIVISPRDGCPYTKGGKYVCGAVVIPDTVENVWSVLNDPESAPNYLDDLVSAKIVFKDSQSVLVEQGMKVKGFPTFQYVVRMVPKSDHIIFKMEKGKLKAFDGGWWVFPNKIGGTIVVYSLYLDVGRMAPQAIVKRSLSKKIPETLVAVRSEVIRRF